MILGRLASAAAKAALLGDEVKVVNCDKVVISGQKKNVFAHEKERRERKGYPLKSAKFSRLPDRMVRRTIRGMLPWKIARGKEAFKRVMCYIGIPDEYKSQKMMQPVNASSDKLPSKYVQLSEVSKNLGGKVFGGSK